MKTDVYCSFCSLPHRVYSKNHIGVPEMLAFGAISMVGSFAIWEEFHWAGCVVFVMLTSLTEIIYRMRWRHSVACKNCGFDPYLYKKAPEDAAQLVKDFLENRRDNPAYLLRPRPQIKPMAKKVDPPRYKGFDATN